MNRALIDGDILVYRIGFACEDEPLHAVEATLRRSLENITSALEGEVTREIYLTGKGNVRNTTATFKEYKGSRRGKRKPKWYKEIRHILEQRHGAIIVDGIEADDILASEGRKDPKNVIICSIDKDLLQVPCMHYNWVKKEKRRVDKKEGDYLLDLQVLTGDSTDDIPGLPGIGPKKAEAILDGKETREEIENAIEDAYIEMLLDDKRLAKFAGDEAEYLYDTFAYDGTLRYISWDGVEMHKSVVEVIGEIRDLVWVGYKNIGAPEMFVLNPRGPDADYNDWKKQQNEQIQK